ncbi:MAG: hypothetical protein H6548_03495 [Chitinophagales bacterium]|nr:hypothetical protein [Chitinophagales bacterium]MCB9021160.1 hypothetical protein [Chitinophagales bacterium]HAE14008.1 hypothetical protein [Bacteroidota bacterium]HQU40624.1 hypothetical protein [Chitinophagales bacterium]
MPIDEHVPIDFDPRWLAVLQQVKDQFGKKPNMESLLFLIGINELGTLNTSFSKEQKQDLMHIAVCTLLEPEGYYESLGPDEDGWPHFALIKRFDVLSLEEQETLLKQNIIRYFERLKKEP